MNIGSVAGYGLEFEDNGHVVDPSELEYITVTQCVEVKAGGQLSAVKQGEDIVFVIYKGKRYGHYVKVSDNLIMTFDEVDTKPKSRTRKKKIEN